MLKDFVALIGRVCFSLIFILAGYSKIIAFGATASMMASKGLPYADILLVLAIIFELGGGILVLLGLYARFGAFLLFVFIFPVTYYFHTFWGMQGVEMVNQMHHFLKNLAILGGTLYIMAFGAGRISFDVFRGKKVHKGDPRV